MSTSITSSGHLSGSRSLLKALTLLLFLPLLWADGAWAAECAQTNYDFFTQAEVDAFGATGCDSVRGDVLINRLAGANIDGLANLTRVDGGLVIDNYKGANIDGLKSLTSVGEDLRIWFNSNIANFDGLANLTNVGGNLRISANASLTNLNGLANLTSVGGFVYISSNEKLTNLDGLAKITNVVGSKSRFVSRGLSILDNRLLTDLNGLANITSVERDLDIERNDSLTNCRGLAMVLGWPNGPPDDAVDGDISLKDNGVGCNSIDEIFASLEQSEIQVTEAYIGLLDRAPDPDGLAYWVSQLNRAVAAGQDATLAMKKLTNDIALSPEWTAGLGANDATTQAGSDNVVEGMYQHLFERAATQADLDWWTPQLTGGSTTAAEMALNLITAAKSNTEKPADGNVLGFKQEAATYYVDNVPQNRYTVASASSAVKGVNDAESLAESKTATDLVRAGRRVLTSSVGNVADDVSAPSARTPAAAIPSLPLNALLLLIGLMTFVGLRRLHV